MIARGRKAFLPLTDGPGSRSWYHRSFGINRSAEMGAAGQRGGRASRRGPGPARHEARSSALLGQFGKERGPPFLECRELGPELFQLAVDPLQLGPRLPFPEVSLTMPGADQILDLTAEQPQPRVPVHRGAPVLQLARADRRDDLVLRQPELRSSRLVAQRRALASPFIAVQLHDRSLSRRAAAASRRLRLYRGPPEASSSRRSPI